MGCVQRMGWVMVALMGTTGCTALELDVEPGAAVEEVEAKVVVEPGPEAPAPEAGDGADGGAEPNADGEGGDPGADPDGGGEVDDGTEGVEPDGTDGTDGTDDPDDTDGTDGTDATETTEATDPT